MADQGIPFRRETWPTDADGHAPFLCTECGTPVRYGSRHSTCGRLLCEGGEATRLKAILPPEESAPPAAPSTQAPDDGDLHDAVVQASAPSVQVSDGWKLVPPEPTVEMNRAGYYAHQATGLAGEIWRAMFAVAPQASAPQVVEPVARVESWVNGSYSRKYTLTWLKDVPEGTLLYASPTAQPSSPDVEADAKRWRTLRDGKTDLMLCWFTSGMEVPCEVSDYDAAIDAELAAEAQKP